MKKAINILATLIGIAIVGAMGYYIGNATSENYFMIIIAAVSLVVSIFLQVIIHELGHLTAGLASGYSFHSFNVLGFVLLFENNKPKIKRHRMAGMGGQCIMQPPIKGEQDAPFSLYLASGVIFNIIFSTLSLVLLSIDNGLINVSVVVFCAVGLLFAIMNGIPFGKTQIPNDMNNLLKLKQKPELVKYLFIQLNVANLAQTMRLKNMPKELFELPPVELNNEFLASSVAVFRFNMLVDSMRFKEAQELGDKLINEYSLVSIHQFIVYNDLIFLELVGENRKDEIKKLMLKVDKNIKKGMGDYPAIIRTDYAVELLQHNNPEAAQKILSRFEKVAPGYAIKADIESERELIAYAKEAHKLLQCNP